MTYILHCFFEPTGHGLLLTWVTMSFGFVDELQLKNA